MGIRAVPIAEAMLAITLMDHLLAGCNRAQNADGGNNNAEDIEARKIGFRDYECISNEEIGFEIASVLITRHSLLHFLVLAFPTTF